MATRIPDPVRNVLVDALVDRIDAGAGPGELRIYSGAQPADADDAATGTLLVTCTFADPAYGSAASGSAALTSAATGTAVAAGTAGWFRIVDSNATTVADGAVRATADPDNGEELVLDNTSIANGQNVSINTLPATLPASE